MNSLLNSKQSKLYSVANTLNNVIHIAISFVMLYLMYGTSLFMSPFDYLPIFLVFVISFAYIMIIGIFIAFSYVIIRIAIEHFKNVSIIAKKSTRKD